MFQEAKNDNQYEKNNKIQTLTHTRTHISPYLCQLHLYLGQCQSYTYMYTFIAKSFSVEFLDTLACILYVVYCVLYTLYDRLMHHHGFSFACSFCFKPFCVLQMPNALHLMSCTEIYLFSTPISSKC